jgi:hypothetical protein
MNERTTFQAHRDFHVRRAASGLALLLLIPACGGAAVTGSAAARMGREVSAHAQAVPQGVEVCALKDALATQAGGPDKPLQDTCGKALKSDRLWQRSMVVLGAYADTLSALASGADAETTGPLEAAQTGVSGPDWVDVEDGKEKAAREAVTEIVKQLRTNTSGGDLEKAVKDAGPHVRTVCDGLVPYLEAQAQGLADARKEIEKRRTTRNDRRCGTLDNRNVCVAESVIDRTVYANAFGRLAALEASHEDARRAAAGFCAAHRKLVEAAEKGELSDKKTYFDIVDAVKSARAADPQGAADTGKDASKK